MSKVAMMAENAFFMLYATAPLMADGDTPKAEIEEQIAKGARTAVQKIRALAASTPTGLDNEAVRLVRHGINVADSEFETPTDGGDDSDVGDGGAGDLVA
ncbi:MAG: hypothetical protein AAGB02_03215 [Pseudomonadota bacterium]